MTTNIPHWRRFEELAVEIVWAAIQALDITDKLTLLRELATEVAAAGVKRGNGYDKVVAAVISLRTAAEVLGHSPSQPGYRLLQKDLPELHLVPDGTVRRWLGNGSWNDCLRRALLDTVSDGDFVALAEGDAFTEPELVAGIRMYMDEHDGHAPTWPHYMAWAHDPQVRARPGRRALSIGPFLRFDGYRAVLERNGLIGPDGTRFDIRGRMLPTQWKYTDSELLDPIRELRDRLGRWPIEADYRKAREEARQKGIGLPSVSTITARFGGNWPSAIQAAGGDPVELRSRPSSHKGRDTSPYTREEMFEALRQAWTAVGDPFSKSAFTRWRKTKLREYAATGNPLRIPFVETIVHEFGSWPEAVNQALPSVPTRRRRKTYE